MRESKNRRAPLLVPKPDGFEPRGVCKKDPGAESKGGSKGRRGEEEGVVGGEETEEEDGGGELGDWCGGRRWGGRREGGEEEVGGVGEGEEEGIGGVVEEEGGDGWGGGGGVFIGEVELRSLERHNRPLASCLGLRGRGEAAPGADLHERC